MNLYNWVIPLGITILCLMLVTALFGLRMKFIKAKLRIRIHKIIAITAIVLALLHGGIVVYFNFFN